MDLEFKYKKEILEKILDRVGEWIRQTDQKISVILAFQGVILTIVIPYFHEWLTKNITTLQTNNLIVFLVAVFLSVSGFIKSALILIARLNKDNYHKSKIYFQDISNTSVEDYKKGIKTLTKQEYLDEVIDQIYVCSKIATGKYAQCNDSIVLLLLSLLALGETYLLYIIPKLYGL